ncbi:MAG: VWA domain-containing protein [Pyrinomonadaceae bacterium]
MKFALRNASICGLLFFVGLFLANTITRAQDRANPTQPAADDDVIRIKTELVQTDIMVFDKKGHFVDGLKPEQFSLKINGQSRPIPFFERVAAGSQMDTSGGRTGGGTDTSATGTSTSGIGTRMGRGRTIIFFVDDLHLSQESLIKTRKSLNEFLDNAMLVNDQVAITSSSGQLGFLQQFTDDKFVLREAVAKLSFRTRRMPDIEKPPMSEYLAAQINNGDKEALDFYLLQLLRDNTIKVNGETIQFVDPASARAMVMNRAREVSMQAGPSTDDTLKMLEGLMRTAAQLPGRKLVFVMSDGFLLTDRRATSSERIKRITDGANRAGVVIYTIDVRGLVNTGLDATGGVMDVNNLLSTANIGELAASQDGMNALARDTGGTPIRNTNAPMAELVKNVLAETSVYYLLAWQPEGDEEKNRKFKKIEVSVIGHPELTVRVRNGYYMTEPLKLAGVGKKEKDPVKARENEIRAMIDTAIPQQEIPTRVGVSVIPVLANSSRLTATIQIDRSVLNLLTPGEGADLDIGAIFYDEKGKPADSFVGKVKVLPLASDASERERAGTIFIHDTWLAPGLYQVRVAVRDVRTGRIGTAAQWVQVNKL